MEGVTDAIVSLQILQAASNNAQATSLIGKDVLYEGGTLRVGANGGMLRLYAEENLSNAVVSLRNASGQVVRAYSIGSVRRGAQAVPLPTGLPAGDYQVTIEGQTASGEDGAAVPLVIGHADGVSFGDDGVTYLQVGNDLVELGDIHSVYESSQA
jgi:flagellar hook assembly protein FlgD